MEFKKYIEQLNETIEGIFNILFDEIGATDIFVVDELGSEIFKAYRGQMSEKDFCYKLYGYEILDIRGLYLEEDYYVYIVVK